jgi:hypothetical protein
LAQIKTERRATGDFVLSESRSEASARYAGSLSPSGSGGTSNALTTPHSIA